jgi:hypothetical protein
MEPAIPKHYPYGADSSDCPRPGNCRGFSSLVASADRRIDNGVTERFVIACNAPSSVSDCLLANRLEK